MQNKIKQEHTYEQTWQVHGYTMLSMDLGVTFPFSAMKHWLCSFVDKNWFFVFEKNIGSMYYSKQEMDLAGYWGKRDFLNNEWFTKYVAESRKLYAKASDLLQKYSAEETSQIEGDKLYQIVREMGLLLTDLYGYFNACQPQCVAQLELDLEKEVAKSVPPEKVREIMLDLTRPETRTLLDEENVAWLKLCSLNLSEHDLEESLQEHSKKFGILGTSDGGSYYTVDYYKRLYRDGDSQKATANLRSKLEQEKGVAKNKKTIIDTNHISDEAQKLAEILSVIGHERFEIRLRGWMSLDYWFTNILLPHLASRFKVETRLLKQLTFQELLQFLLTGYCDQEELEERNQFFIVGMKDGRVYLQSGAEAKEYAKKLYPMLQDSGDEEKELKGQIAQKGLVRGQAYVLHWDAGDIVKEMDDMPSGSVLIAGQTRPQLMMAIRRSAAIVTDEGGITSHAAIVSRELRIPCVIGTKTATKLIKTGDTVEVDANNGIVRILERK